MTTNPTNATDPTDPAEPSTAAPPSDTDLPTTVMTPEATEALGLTDEMTRPLPALETDDVWHGPIAPVGSSSPAGTGGAGEPAGGASTARRGPNTSALMWGLVLLVVGGLLTAVALGLHIDPVTALIVLLVGLGAVLLIVALVPRPGPEPRRA